MAPVPSRTHAWETVLAGRWQNFYSAVQDAVDAAFVSGSDGYQFQAGRWKYEVDFERMVQTNLSTKRERAVRRAPLPTVSKAPAAPSPAPPVLAAKPAAASVSPKPKPVTKTPTAPSPAPAALATKLAVASVLPKPKPVTKAPAAPSPAPPALAAKPAVASASPKPKPVTKSAVTLAPKASSLSPAVPAPAPRLASKTTGAKTLPAGRIKIFFQDKGYGFIALNDGTEAFFHVSTLDDGVTVKKNDMVEVSISKDRSGKLRASKVILVKKAPLMRLICRNPTCCSKGDRHFEDRCPLGGFSSAI